MSKINIHEDDVGMRNLYPAVLIEEVQVDIDKASEASERNLSATGAGWDAVHIIEPPSKKFSDFGLKLDVCSAALESILPRVNEFSIGGVPSNPFYSKEDSAYCYGLGNELYIKLETEGTLVAHIWFDVWTANKSKLSLIRKALLAVDELMPSIVADYWLNVDGRLSDSGFMDDYFNELAKFEGKEP